MVHDVGESPDDLKAELAGLRADIKSALAQLQRTLITWMVSLFIVQLAVIVWTGLYL